MNNVLFLAFTAAGVILFSACNTPTNQVVPQQQSNSDSISFVVLPADANPMIKEVHAEFTAMRTSIGYDSLQADELLRKIDLMLAKGDSNCNMLSTKVWILNEKGIRNLSAYPVNEMIQHCNTILNQCEHVDFHSAARIHLATTYYLLGDTNNLCAQINALNTLYPEFKHPGEEVCN